MAGIFVAKNVKMSNSINDQFGNRMKDYENTFRTTIPNRLPVILRLDGCHFSKYTKGLVRPFDDKLISAMNDTAIYLCKNIQGAQMAYIQSDEISILINNYKEINTQPWHKNNAIKMCSVASGLASSYFSSISDKIFGNIKLASFDCRAFVVPKEEVNNVFLWRQQDNTRNSIQSLARSLFSQKQCHLKNTSELKKMCAEKGNDWDTLSNHYKYGRCALKIFQSKLALNHHTKQEEMCVRSEWIIDNNIPIFSKDTNYINKYV
jgi:tRNA(His) 5'-end guanylyltransferase